MSPEEFDAYYAASFERLVAQVYAMCGDLAEAQDCVQEAFVRAWDQRRRFATDSTPDAWVRTVAYRLAVSSWRKRRRNLAWNDADAPITQLSDDRLIIQRALNQLPEKLRRAAVLYYLVDLSVAEVATEMGAPQGSVKGWLSRARAQLEPLLDDSPEVLNV